MIPRYRIPVLAAALFGGVACAPPPPVGDVSHLPVQSIPVRAVEVIDDAHFVVMPPAPPEPKLIRTFDFDNTDKALDR